MSDLSAFLEIIRLAPTDNTTRLVFADYLDENYPATPVFPHRLPKRFNAYWHRRRVGREFRARFEYQRLGAVGRWSNDDILDAINAAAISFGGVKRDYPASSEVGGYPVLVIEPRIDEAVALRLCAVLQPMLGGCPVSYSRRAARSGTAARITIWYTAMPSEEQLTAEAMERVASSMDHILEAAEATRTQRGLLFGCMTQHAMIPPELASEVEAFAESRGLSFKSVMLDALRRHLDSPPPLVSDPPLPACEPDQPTKKTSVKGKPKK